MDGKVVATDPRSVSLPRKLCKRFCLYLTKITHQNHLCILDFNLPDKIGPSNFKVFALDTTPELKQVRKLVMETYRYTFFQRLLGWFIKHEISHSSYPC
jgi:hypothetical protein